ILNAVDERQKKIASYLNSAKEQAKKAEEEQILYAQKVDKFKEERQNLLLETKVQAEHIKESLLTEVKEEVQKNRQRWQNDLLHEKEAFSTSLRNLMIEQFRLFADQSLSQMAGVSLDRLIEEEFKKKFLSLSAKEKKAFSAFANQSRKITFISASQLLPTDKKRIKDFISKALILDADVIFTFQQDASLLAGLEVQTGEQAISWNLKQYLEQFQTNLDGALTGLIRQE
ncbi:MAG: hypothetical protein EOM53_06135, partial [Alphaproteobacteria bacterium]|nr:hypothetical protein [Alphaproteobacteria bacterium]